MMPGIPSHPSSLSLQSMLRLFLMASISVRVCLALIPPTVSVLLDASSRLRIILHVAGPLSNVMLAHIEGKIYCIKIASKLSVNLIFNHFCWQPAISTPKAIRISYYSSRSSQRPQARYSVVLQFSCAYSQKIQLRRSCLRLLGSIGQETTRVNDPHCSAYTLDRMSLVFH